MSKLTVCGNKLYMDGQPFQLISGAIHYFRVVPEYWNDRLKKLRACGFNCVETYVPWNLHEPKEGQFNFSGIANIERFIQIADEIGLYVIVRPSPYICAEWDFGGLPSWLLSDRNMRIRSYYKPFLEKVDNYYDVLLEKLLPLLSTNGGPIIAMQVENEYGSYGNDKRYLAYLRDGMIKRGIDVLLFTSDGPTDLMLQGGTIDNVLPTVNFGSRPQRAFNKLQKNFPGIPNIVMEYWNGWFDHWGEMHHTREAQDVADTFEEMISRGDSVNFYMFHGGTNFGFYNGANHGEYYEPTITSYDYDCLVSEDGEITSKFHAIREVVSRYKNIGDIHLPEPIPKMNYGKVEIKESIRLFEAINQLAKPVKRANPQTMEELGQDYGFILYQTFLKGPHEKAPLYIDKVRDRALVFVNKTFMGVIDRWKNQSLDIEVPEEGAILDILVENMGRVNYGSEIYDYKGITRGVRFSYQFLFNWSIYCLPLNNIDNLMFNEHTDVHKQPAFYRGVFYVDDIGDTFVKLSGWKKGVVFINGFNLGRYWEIGPQQTLYLPGPLLRKGENEIVVFELHEPKVQEVKLINEHDIG